MGTAGKDKKKTFLTWEQIPSVEYQLRSNRNSLDTLFILVRFTCSLK